MNQKKISLRLYFVFHDEICLNWVAVFVSVTIIFYSYALSAAVSLQVATFLRDCKGRGYRQRVGKTENE